MTHITSFGKPHPCDGNSADTTLELVKGGQPGALITSSFTGGGPSGNYSSNYLPAGPTCFYCRKGGHIMSECQALPRKNEWSEKPDLLVSPSFQTDHKKTSKLPDEYTPFISCGSVSLVGSQVESPITNLLDTGATQSLILEGVLPFSSQSDTALTVLLQGAELGTFHVPLHKVSLKCGLVTGAVVVGVRPSLPVQGVSLILGNDLAGGQVACVSNVPQDSVSPTVAAEQAPTKVYRVSNSQQDVSREQEIGYIT